MAEKDIINPYLLHLGSLYDRLKWDLNYKSYKSRSRLKKYMDSYNGEKALILCNGPSLNRVDFNLIKKSGIKTFGLNKINLLFDSVDFRPSFIVSINKHVIRQNKKFFNSTDIPLFLKSKSSSEVRFRKNIAFLHATLQFNVFADDVGYTFCEGYTVTYVALQLAFHMGFSNVGLVGCDHNFATKGKANTLIDGLKKDENHFHPQYFDESVKWQLPDLNQSEAHYFLAKERYELANRNVFNCTEGGKLEIFKRISLEKFLNNDF